MCFGGGGSSYTPPRPKDVGQLTPTNTIVGQDLPGPAKVELPARRITSPDDLRRPPGSTENFLRDPGDTRGTRAALASRSRRDPLTTLMV